MNIRQQVNERLRQIRELNGKVTDRTNEEITESFVNYYSKWEDYIYNEGNPNGGLKQGQVVQYNGIKYLVMQDITQVLSSQKPSDEGMLAIYKPYRDSKEYEWLYGEYVEIGWIRTVTKEVDGEIVITKYVAIQGVGANIYSPELVPAIWEVIED